MDSQEAEVLYNSGKEPTVSKLIELATENKILKEKIAKLETNSSNSHKPPSSDGPKDKESDKDTSTNNDSDKKKKRKPGGQPDHKGTNRELIPTEEADDVIHYYPHACEKCGKKLPRDETANVTENPFRWQVAEIEPIKATVTEHQGHTTKCECGHHTSAKLPPEVKKSNFGPRLSAIIAYLTAVLHVSRRGSKEFCTTLLNLKIALGSLQNLLEETSEALAPADKELKDTLPDEPVLNADETSWRDRWLWIFVSSTYIYFKVAVSRKHEVLIDVLGEFYKGILCVDRWGAYTKYHKGLFQICWAHLKRDFLKIEKIGKSTQSADALFFAQRMDTLRKKMMSIWHQYKRGEIYRSELIEKTESVRRAIKRCLTRYRQSEHSCVRSLARRLYNRYDDLFTFIFYEGVEPTNNSAERGIRPAVQWRKICFGNRSDTGAVATSRLLTATRTCWLQRRNPLEFLADTISAHRAGKTTPSLLD